MRYPRVELLVKWFSPHNLKFSVTLFIDTVGDNHFQAIQVKTKPITFSFSLSNLLNEIVNKP